MFPQPPPSLHLVSGDLFHVGRCLLLERREHILGRGYEEPISNHSTRTQRS